MGGGVRVQVLEPPRSRCCLRWIPAPDSLNQPVNAISTICSATGSTNGSLHHGWRIMSAEMWNTTG